MVVSDLLTLRAFRGIVKNGILGGDIDWVVWGVLFMAVFAIGSVLFSTVTAWFAARVGEEVGHRLRCSVHEQVSQVSWGNVAIHGARVVDVGGHVQLVAACGFYDRFVSHFRGDATPPAAG